MWAPVAVALLIGACSAAAQPRITAETLTADAPCNASVTVDLQKRKAISPVLFGIFFEEIGHAGDGGLYAELVQDRSFDALAAATGFLDSPATRLPLDLATLAARHHHAMLPLHTPWDSNGRSYSSKREYLEDRRRNSSYDPRNDIIVAWQPLPGTTAVLTKEQPLNEHNLVSMELTAGTGPHSGLLNFGYWGLYVQAGHNYTASLYMRNPDEQPKNVTLSLVGEHGATLYGTLTFLGVEGGWRKYTAEVASTATDANARLLLQFDGPGKLVVDSVSLFPSGNVAAGSGMLNPWPFRADLLDALKALQPAFMRFPGGCYIEGDWMRNAFRWKAALGPNEQRPGHMNGVWGYWSTDGLGLFEYMLLAEELATEPIWVINNGVAHGDSVRTADVWPLVEEALDSLEFISGPPDSQWGGVRAAMGHPEPWTINYMAIGNEDCGKPSYLTNYLLFFGAIRARYPHMRLISNCDMGPDAPTDLWDWHIYTNPTDMFKRRNEFNGKTPQNSHYIFASEYAVTDGGGWGNVAAAVSEAAFMSGMERNGDIVTLGAYAPLFVHWNNRPWPTNMIVIDNSRWFGIPSYYVQQMFSHARGSHYLDTTVVTDPGSQVHQESVAASTTCASPACDRINIKIINFSSMQQRVAVVLTGEGSDAVLGEGELVYLWSDHPEAENSFDTPTKIAPATATMDGLSSKFVLPAKPWSVNVLQLHLGPAPSSAAITLQADISAIIGSGMDGVAAS
ncbi:Alpha-L-arabinofuranosidase 1 [Chlorella vulgaris]